MTEKTKLKFIVSAETNELISFISKNSKTGKLRGVREDSEYSKKICVLSNDIKANIVPNILYDVEVKEMHKSNGYVVVCATPILFAAKIEATVIAKVIYKVCVSFGNKTVYFDPIDGKTQSSKTIAGVLEILKNRQDIKNKDLVIEDFKKQANMLVKRLTADGYIVK